ncbi:MAG: amino acid ABC transporter substrate-binding protein [Pseudomonadaceae bacterium]|nr:amino acid ABC transporter substrate-binding protein [Pseudomonadaceae bacterium]
MRILPAILAALVTALLAVWLISPTSPAPTATESAFDHILRTGTIRCGYYVFPPMLMFNETTRKPYGLAVDMMNRIAAKTSLKVEWVEEINFGNWMSGLITKRYDAVCTPMWPNAAMTRESTFGKPMMYAAIWPYTRQGDTRFDNNLATLNTPATTIAVQEGNITAELVNELFPNAKQYAIPGNTDFGLAIEAVRSGKADVVLWDANGAYQYQLNNPKTLHQVKLAEPLQIMPFAIPFPRGEHTLKHLMDTALDDMLNTGTFGRMIDKWEPAPGMFLRLAKPYQ